MNSRKAILTVMLLVSAFVTACAPAPRRDSGRSIGRNSRGPIGPTVNGRVTSYQPGGYQSGGSSRQWGQITNPQGDQYFADQLYYFTLPMLEGASADQQLGYVSSSANSSTNVVFWGEASMYGSSYGGSYGGSGQLDGSKARIHIEIWDDKAVNQGLSPTVVHIGSDFPGFVSATGSVNGSQATLVFTDSYGSVALQGVMSGQMYSGTIYFSNSSTGNQYYPLGNFQVPACGFFVCN